MYSAATLNPEQRQAAEFTGTEPLLIIAGAGSGKTTTLAHRVAHLLRSGVDPARILLLTFSRRAAHELASRTRKLIGDSLGRAVSLPWAGTFHGIANRLLRDYAANLSLSPEFTVLDRGDAADLLDYTRGELGMANTSRRFPKKATCLSIYSRVVNSQRALEDTLNEHYPWCKEWRESLEQLFRAYVDRKQDQSVLDYDDLLLFWYFAAQDPTIAKDMGCRFDHVLVDEYQDVNNLQASILCSMKPSGSGVTAVGDDCQAIYGFRGANVRNILDFPRGFQVPARVVTLDRNYRSTQPILDACNAVIAEAKERFDKNLYSEKLSEELPRLATVEDELAQVDYVIEEILKARESGIELRDQAVLFRASHHSDALEVELGRRNIPYVKFGGIKFLEAAHVKDVVAVLRFAENPRDEVAGFRLFQMLPQVGPKTARRILRHLRGATSPAEAMKSWEPPTPVRSGWNSLCDVITELSILPWEGQLGAVMNWFIPILDARYDNSDVRARDLEQLETIAVEYRGRSEFLSEVTLDPPDSTGDLAGKPHLDEDYLILSTIHSAKGQEWESVYVLNLADGCIPSDMATGSADEIEEERRLLYVAMTRAKRHLHLVHPLKFYVRTQHRHGDRKAWTPLSRFLPSEVVGRFERVARTLVAPGRRPDGPALDVSINVRDRVRGMFAQ